MTLAPEPPTHGTLRVRNAPSGTGVSLDGDPVGTEVLRLPAGERTLSVAPTDGTPRDLLVRIHPGGATEVDLAATPARPPRALRGWAWAALATGVAGAVAGAVFTVRYAEDLDQERNATGTPAVEAARDDAVLDAALAQAGFGIAVTGVGAALVRWMFDETPADP